MGNLACDCFNQVDEKLRKDGLGFPVDLMMSGGKFMQSKRMRIVVERKRKGARIRIPMVIANYCPVCGKKYPEYQ